MAKIYIARQSIFNVNGKVYGHELFFRDNEGGMTYFPSDLSATSRVLLNVTNHMNFDAIKGAKDNLLFINVNHAVINSGILEMLDPDHFIIELLETTQIDDNIIKRIKRLKQMGFRFALDDFDCSKRMIEQFKGVLPYMDIVKFDILSADVQRMAVMAKKFKASGMTLLAEKIETKDQYLTHSRMGFDLFQGYYFHMPENIEATMNLHTEAYDLLNLIQMIKDDYESKEIEQFFRSKPDMSFNLIKYLNSSQVGLKSEIYSIEHAIALIGRKQLLKWLLLYLYSEHHATELPERVLKTAIARAEKMEQLVPGEQNKMAYLTGMYSLLDVLFDMEMEELMESIRLDKTIAKAILEGKGVLGESLQKIKQEESHSLKQMVMDNFDRFSNEDLLSLLEKANVIDPKQLL